MDQIARVFAIAPEIRYVAVYRRSQLTSRQRDDAAGASAAESDRYEELFVNPALLTLVRQRGDLDCGGAEYLVVRYGRFHQLVMPLAEGHVSVCFELSANPIAHADEVRALFTD